VQARTLTKLAAKQCLEMNPREARLLALPLHPLDLLCLKRIRQTPPQELLGTAPRQPTTRQNGYPASLVPLLLLADAHRVRMHLELGLDQHPTVWLHFGYRKASAVSSFPLSARVHLTSFHSLTPQPARIGCWSEIMSPKNAASMQMETLLAGHCDVLLSE
jgi:hypothetical protein